MLVAAIAVFVFVLKHAQVGGEAAGRDESLLEGLAHGATGFAGVGAVLKAALLSGEEYFAEVVGEFGGLNVEGAEALDARGVDELASVGEGEHLTEGGGVLPGVVALADVGGGHVESGDEVVEEGALAHAAVAREEGGLAGE